MMQKLLPIKPLERPTLTSQLRLIAAASLQALVGIVMNFCIFTSEYSYTQLSAVAVPMLFVYSAYILLVPAFGYFFSCANYRLTSLVFISMCFGVTMILLIHQYLIEDPNNVADGNVAVKAFFLASIPEEIIKMICYMIPLYTPPKIAYGYHLVFAAAVSGLAFGVIENGIYISVPSNKIAVTVGYYRFALTTLLHASFCMIGGIFITYAKCGIWKREYKYLAYVLAFVVPVALHGVYDLLLFLKKEVPGNIAIVLTVLCYITPFAMAIPLRKAHGSLPTTSDPNPSASGPLISAECASQ